MTEQARRLKGILAMLVAVAMFSCMDAAMKSLVDHYSAMQIACLRGLLAWPLVVMWLFATRRVQHLLRARWPLHLFRAVLGITMLASFVFSLQSLSLADAYAIFFAAPLLITALSVWWLREKVDGRQWLAIVVGLLAVLYMLKPSGDNWLSLGALAALLAAVCYAVSGITVRVLARTDDSGNMVFWLMTLLTLGAGLLAWPDWKTLQAQHWLPFLVIAMTGAVGQVAITEAFRLAPASVIAPFEYTAMLWGVGFDVLLWQVWPSAAVLLGAGVIMASGLYLIARERH